MINEEDEFNRIKNLEEKRKIGIKKKKKEIDLERKMEWKDGIVNRMKSGVEGILKR